MSTLTEHRSRALAAPMSAGSPSTSRAARVSSSANRILVVDSGTAWRDQLGACRHGWNLRFVSSRAEALSALAADPYDLIITELELSGTDGVTLLAEVHARWPQTARMLVTGPADQEAILRALPVCHQLIRKPCDSGQLWQLVERTHSLHGLMRNAELRALVGGLERLPSVSATYLELTQAIARRDVGSLEIAAIVERDTAMAIKVLQLANSAYFGPARRLDSIHQAVVVLGTSLLQALALSTQVFGMLRDAPLQEHGLENLQNDALLTAQLSRRFLASTGRGDEAFTTGLIQNAGRIVLSLGVPERYREVVHRVRLSQAPLPLVEREVFGVSHAEVGAYLLSIWGLPAAIIEAVAFHHDPSGVLHDDIDLVAAAHVADALVAERMQRPGAEPLDRVVDPLFLARPGMAAKLARWRSIASDEWARSEA